MACKCFEEQRLLRRAVGQWRRNEVHRAVRVWEDEYIKWLKGRLALNRMMNAGLTKALNAWVEGWRAGREARRKLEVALARMVNAGSAKALRAWADRHRAERAKMQKLRAAAARLSPEGRAKGGVLRKLRGIVEFNAKLRRGAAVFVNLPLKRAINSWRATTAQAAQMRKGLTRCPT